jgi:hypothetical protein
MQHINRISFRPRRCCRHGIYSVGVALSARYVLLTRERDVLKQGHKLQLIGMKRDSNDLLQHKAARLGAWSTKRVGLKSRRDNLHGVAFVRFPSLEIKTCEMEMVVFGDRPRLRSDLTMLLLS